MSKERPILFSGEMVRAILDGRKTQTRRVVSPQPHAGVRKSALVASGLEDGHGYEIRARYGRPGDRLWVREAFCWPGEEDVIYRADEGAEKLIASMADLGIKWRPSIFMLRQHSRITLEITGVRVERVQEIDESDAMDEGAGISLHEYPQWDGDPDCYRKLFRERWNAINAHRGFGWDVNPWVWVIEFQHERSEVSGQGPKRTLPEVSEV